MKKNLNYLLLLMVALMGLQATAAVPSGYYDNAKNKSDQALMSALHQIIRGHTKRSYQQLWTDFKTTDCNGNIIIDRYSTTQFTYSTDQCGSYNGVGDCYNREHSIPNSWWGGSASDTAYTDLHHMFPVDGWVNNERGNFPFGDCNNGTPKGTGKLGNCTFSGYSGTVFEVADEYKGDFARVYFYFATRYMTRINNFTNGTGSVVFTSSSYLGLTTWAINQLLEWHRNDPVSTLETARNNAVHDIQRNRNPFVDNPELVEYIWGNKRGSVWNASSTPTPTLTAPANGSTINVGTNTGNGVSKSITVSGSNLTKALTVSVSGTGFSVSPTSITAANANNGTTVTVTYNGTSTNATGTLTIISSEVSATVNLKASYNTGGGGSGTETIETWEGCNGYGSYTDKSVQGAAFTWYFVNAGLFAQTNDHWNGALGCRFGKNADSYIMMTEDVTNGASKVTFYAANYGSDAAPTMQVQYSTDGGSTWTTAGSCSPGSTWQQYTFNLNVTGNVRFKFNQTAGSRLNIDDIAITSNNSTPVINPFIHITAIAAIEAEQGASSSVVSADISGVENNEDITVSVDGNFEISLNRNTWSRTLTLDPSGEVIYVRLADTNTVGEYYGTLSARTSQVSAYADIQGTVTAKPVLLGDVNMDDILTIADVTKLINYLLSGSAPAPFNVDAADVNQDTFITIADVTRLINIILSGTASLTTWNAYPADGGILCENHSGEMLEIYDFDGNCSAVVMPETVTTVDLPVGIYIVASDTESRKVVVK